MVDHLARLCECLKDCDVGCIVLTAKYSDYCKVEKANERGVFIAPMAANRRRQDGVKNCTWEMDIDFMIAPFVKCSLSFNQVVKLDDGINGGLVESWDMLDKIKECIKCKNDFYTCDKTKPFFIMERILTPDCCGPFVVLPTVWSSEYTC